MSEASAQPSSAGVSHPHLRTSLLRGSLSELSLSVQWYALTIYQVFLEPFLLQLNLVKAGFGDATYGRGGLEDTPKEKRLIHENRNVRCERRRVALSREQLRIAKSWSRFEECAYQVWQWDGQQAQENVRDGLHLMRKGFRVIALDLPSFGRSTGLHAWLPSLRLNVEAVRACLDHVALLDSRAGLERRKVFLQGESMGGFTALYYAATYPSIDTSSSFAHVTSQSDLHGDRRTTEHGKERPVIAGVAAAAPMIAISPSSRPSKLVENIARVIIFFAGRLPFAKGVKGNVSDDPRVETEFLADPFTYKGYLRISTGMAILQGLAELQDLAPRITCPITFHHGAKDRATSWKGTREFCERCTASTDKSFRIWEGYEHIMMKNVEGQSQEDEDKRMAVLDAITDWYLERC
ncbi:Lysophospholipase [Ceraceosorus bombacis]|uniref:Lysophospholipase n=1 Tax=Ceraceosorus bombacis TaxID=401625 RepID=A0A0P1B8U7_9BASI|nr:Lysophospholipase [Ceraceosorus bombacis]